jgi:3-hydroxyanthranilate 3,4-dioxygenase
MMPMPIVDLLARGRELAERGERVSVLWQQGESLAFVARGREYRSEFHINPSDEVMLMIKGDMRLHYRTPEGKEDVAWSRRARPSIRRAARRIRRALLPTPTCW